ncbi:MAG: hypothetical protein R2873_04910 [Caldilineaceae bacterium]|nr:hypothetical protein [Caldilineaceae bacterium]
MTEADILLKGSDDTLLVVEVKERQVSAAEIPEQIEWWRQRLPKAQRTIFALVDLSMITFYELPADMTDTQPKLLFSASMLETLSVYDPDLLNKLTAEPRGFMFGYYLEGLVKAWLADVLHGWRGDVAPHRADFLHANLITAFQHSYPERRAALPA